MADAKQIHFRLNMSKGSTPGPQRHPNPMGSWNLCSVRRLLKIQGVQINRHISRHVNAFHIILPNLTKSYQIFPWSMPLLAATIAGMAARPGAKATLCATAGTIEGGLVDAEWQMYLRYENWTFLGSEVVYH